MRNSIYHIIFVALFFPLVVQAQKVVNLSGLLERCVATDSIRIYGFLGNSLQQLAVTPLQQQGEKSAFSVNINGLEKGFYFLGVSPSSVAPLILGDEPSVMIEANCRQFNQNLKISGSAINKEYNDINQKMNALSNEAGMYFMQLRNQPPGTENPTVNEMLKKLDIEKMRILDSLNKSNPYLAKLAALRIYKSYQNYKKPNEDEANYFGRAYFEFVDFKDPVYEKTPAVFEVVQQYAATLGQVGLSAEDQQQYADKLFEGLAVGSPTRPTVLMGLVAGFQGKDEDSFVKYAKLYVKDYAGVNPSVTQQLSAQIAASEPFLIGAMAPDFKLKTPEGKEVALSDYKGKVVMVDFWASWCRPCRKENPKVVAMYNKLKGKNFDILSVSLDQDKAAWENAIIADKLTWTHVSDLAGWQCAPAKLYRVSSVPYTLVVDKDGKIAAKNLRGDALEKKIEKILGLIP